MPAKKKVAAPARTRSSSPIPDSLRQRMAAINEASGPGSACVGSAIYACNIIPLGPLALNLALGGGIPDGQCFMAYGFESGGKSLALNLAVAGFQKKYPTRWAVIVDAEKMHDMEWAVKLGVDRERLIVLTPSTGEEAADMIRDMMDDENVGFVGLDSVPGCVPRGMAYNSNGSERSAEDDTMGLLARLMGKLSSLILMKWGERRKKGYSPCTVFLVNQWRYTIGGFSKDPRNLPGGMQIRHLPSTRCEMKKGDEEEQALFKPLTYGQMQDEEGEEGGKKKNKFGKEKKPAGEGMKQVKTREFNFKITKRKHCQTFNEGCFSVVLAPGGENGLPQGAIDDAGTVRVYAQKMGLFGGSAGRYKFVDYPEAVFAKHSEADSWLKNNPEQCLLIRATIAAMIRVLAGVAPFPPDDYLEGVHNASTKITLPSIAAGAIVLDSAPQDEDEEEGEGA